MRAMILAAGLGQRLLPLTATVPKPLIKAGKHSLIEHHLYSLKLYGVDEVVINISHLGAQIMAALGDGSRYDLKIKYSIEAQPLGISAGIRNALPLLGEAPFLLCSADMWLKHPIDPKVFKLATNDLAHLILVKNPSWNSRGDFGLSSSGRLMTGDDSDKLRLTYAGIGWFHPELFKYPADFVDLLKSAAEKNLVSGHKFNGRWYNINQITELQALRKFIDETGG